MLCEALMVFVKRYLFEWYDENAFSVTLEQWLLLIQPDGKTELKAAVLQSTYIVMHLSLQYIQNAHTICDQWFKGRAATFTDNADFMCCMILTHPCT